MFNDKLEFYSRISSDAAFKPIMIGHQLLIEGRIGKTFPSLLFKSLGFNPSKSDKNSISVFEQLIGGKKENLDTLIKAKLKIPKEKDSSLLIREVNGVNFLYIKSITEDKTERFIKEYLKQTHVKA